MNDQVLVVLSGCGVYDGAEIQESVLTLLALDKAGIAYQCAAPNENQYHVVNHLNGEEQAEQRNILTEAARIARGDIKDLSKVSIADYRALVIPGGFGAAKNLSTWAFDGPEAKLQQDVKQQILMAISEKKPVLAMCMAPVVVAKALEGSGVSVKLTVGTADEPTPYEIDAIGDGMNSLGATAQKANVSQVVVDADQKVITTPCYMMTASISEINTGIENAVDALKGFL